MLSKLTTTIDGRSKNFIEAKFSYEDKLPVIDIEEMFRIYANTFKGKSSYSLCIEVGESDFNFTALKKHLIELVEEDLSCRPELIKENKKGNKVVYCKTLPGSLSVYDRVIATLV